MNRNNNLIIRIMAVFSCLAILYYCYPKSSTIQIEGDGAIYIPVKIFGKTYPFLFDTGSTYTSFNNELLQELGSRAKINPKDSTIIILYGQFLEEISAKNYNPIPIQIGDFRINTSFVGRETNKWNILGMDVINRFHWLIDFKDSTLTISNLPIEIKNEQLTGLDLINVSENNMYFYIQFGDSVYRHFLFDTGNHTTGDRTLSPTEVSMNMNELSIATIVPGQLNKLVDEFGNIGEENYSFTPHSDGIRRLIFPKLRINGYLMKYVMADFHENLNQQKERTTTGTLTLCFATNRFRYLRINPETKKVSFFSDGSEDTTNVRQVKYFYNYQMEKTIREMGGRWKPREE